MTFKLRLYAGAEEERQHRPVATLTVSDRRKQATWLPEQPAAEARFFLERVETPDETLARRIRSALERDSTTVTRGGRAGSGGLRTRGLFQAEEPHGTPVYWRAAVGLLPHEVGLRYDLDDYGRMLERMDATLPSQPAPEDAVADRSRVRRQASFHLLREVGRGWWAGIAAYDAGRREWTLPVHHESLGPNVPLGEIVLNERGAILRAPSRRDLEAAQRALAGSPAAQAVEMLAALGRVLRGEAVFAGALRAAPLKGVGAAAPEEAGPTAEAPSLAAVAEQLGIEPEVVEALSNLGVALSEPETRAQALRSLALLARAAGAQGPRRSE